MSRTSRVCACGMADHTPQYAEVDSHHVFPKYMAGLLGIPERKETVALSSGCHDQAHHVIHHLINEGTVGGHRLAPGLRALVDQAWEWWQEEVR